jgi:hypothetical protein
LKNLNTEAGSHSIFSRFEAAEVDFVAGGVLVVNFLLQKTPLMQIQID